MRSPITGEPHETLHFGAQWDGPGGGKRTSRPPRSTPPAPLPGFGKDRDSTLAHPPTPLAQPAYAGGALSRAGGPALSHGGVGDRPWRREQLPDQPGSLVEAPRLGGSCGGEVRFDLFQHPRQRHGQGEEGAV